MIITEIQHEERTFEKGPPWLLNKNYKDSFEHYGLKQTFHTHSAEAEMGDEIHLSIFQKKPQ
jgi:hypothetical protein